MRRFSIIDLVISIGAIILVLLALVPAVARLQRTPEDARCQSNMRRWAEAMALYTDDYDRRYPTNRILPTMMMSPQMPLSPREFDQDGNPIRFTRSINWVEALFPYLISEAKMSGRDWESVLKCPNASDAKYPPTSTTARVSYAFNYNLLEYSPAIIRDQAKTMMIREMDRLMESVCRPANNSTGNYTILPQSPFLIDRDYMLRNTVINYRLHGEGSHILFADGHVTYFSTDYFPTTVSLSAADCWDAETGQWWNWVNKDPQINKAIAVTP